VIHIRSVINEHGTTIDHDWYCSERCYREGLEARPPSASLTVGGVWPGDSAPASPEVRSPEVCAACGEPIDGALAGGAGARPH
jgi:hypothetical protein